jgi:flavorubredoxin
MSTAQLGLDVRPYRVAPDTFVIPQMIEAPPVGHLYLNSMIITGAEPVIVDTGTPSYRKQWLDYAWNIVDPADVRWVFLTHDDLDHAGNLRQVLDACPNATLVTTWFSIGRLSTHELDGWLPPLPRCRWINDDETFSAGDRTLVAVRPPFFDNPTTRGLFDASTGVYWSADSFAANVPHAVDDAAELERDEWRDGILLVNRLNHPWHLWLDTAKFHAHVDHVQSHDIQVIATCHGPAIHGAMVDEAFELIRRIPDLPRWTEPGQADLDAMLAAAMVAPSEASGSTAGG